MTPLRPGQRHLMITHPINYNTTKQNTTITMMSYGDGSSVLGSWGEYFHTSVFPSHNLGVSKSKVHSLSLSKQAPFNGKSEEITENILFKWG